MKKADWPRVIKNGSVQVKIYRTKHKKTRSGYVYQVVSVGADKQRKYEQFAAEQDAEKHARQRAAAIAEGRTELSELSRGDIAELAALHALAGDIPPLSALREWKRAHEIARGHLIDAAELWAKQNPLNKVAVRGLVEQCIDDFIADKEAAGKEGERTYRAKLKPLSTAFKGRAIADLTALELNAFLGKIKDGVTRNDIRKRCVALWRWAQKHKRIPHGAEREIELTERAAETPTEIGIIDAAFFKRFLTWLRAHHPHYLAAVALAGFTGMRIDELHGKKKDRSQRQLWKDIFAERGFARVSAAKKNTPSWRNVPLCPAAVAWLSVSPYPHEGYICAENAFESLRKLARENKFVLPENCFRHSYISHRIPVVDGNKPQVATEAGNSVKEIDRRYRVPLTKEEGLAWFSIMPG